MPRILIPIHDFNAGGTENIAFRLAAEWLARGWEVCVLAGDHAGPMRARVPAGAEVRVLAEPVPRSALSRLRLGAAMAADAVAIAPDLVFIPGNFHFVLAHALKRALPGVPVVAKISNPLLPGGTAGEALARLGRGLLARYLAPIDMAVAMSTGLEEDYRRLAPQAPVTTVLDPNIPEGTSAPTMRDRRAADGPVRLLAIGRLEPQKDMALAIEVLAQLRQRGPAHLTILGEGYLRPRLERLAARLGVAEQLAMPGFVADIDAAMDAADVLLVSSRYEGGPATAVEALARALPVVSTDCSHFLRGLIVDPRLGRLVPGRDAGALAAAVQAQMASEPAPRALLQAAIAPSGYAASAEGYLKVFADLLGRRSA